LGTLAPRSRADAVVGETIEARCARGGRQEVDRWALFVAVLALGFTAYSFFRQHGLQQRLAAIEEDRRREEVASRSQADVGARFES